MKRLKWMRVESSSSMREIAKQIQKAAFRDGAENGFLLDRARDNALDARYIEKTEFIETFIDPLGNTQAANRVLYKEVDFTLTRNCPELELRMPPRGLASFMNSLMKAANFSMSIESYNVDLLRWTKAIEKHLGIKTVIRGAVASDVELLNGATARVGVVAPKDVRPGLTEILMGRKHKLSTLQLEFVSGGIPQRLSLASDCSIRYSERLADNELDAVRETLTEILVR
jgi:hypothetical protein